MCTAKWETLLKQWKKPSKPQTILICVTFGLGWLIPWLLFRNSKKSKGFLHEPVSGVFIALFAVASLAVMVSFSKKKIDVKLLQRWNLLLFVLHFASGVALAWLADTNGTWTAYVTFSRSQWAKNKPDNATAGFDEKTCQDGNCYITTVPCLLSQANIEYMVLAFHLLSTLQHLAVCLDWDEHYTRNIKDGNHWMRWFEYAFSASIMFASWAFLCGITDVIALVPLCVSVGTVQIFGYLSDAAARMMWPNDVAVKTRNRSNAIASKDDLNTTLLFTNPLQSKWDAFISNRPLQVKVVGVVYITYAAVLAWPLAVQDDIALLVDVTTVILALHFVLGGAGILFAKCSQNKSGIDVLETVYPLVHSKIEIGGKNVYYWMIFYIVYDLLQLGGLVFLGAARDTIIQDYHDWARNIAYLALGGVALCMLKVAPYARNTKATQNTLEATQQSGANRFISPIWIFTLAWVPYLLGAWFMTFTVFHDSLQHPGPNAGDPPDALYVIIVTQFLFFSCFAGAQLWYLWDPYQQRYLDTEFYFCLLSLVSKTALAWSLYSGASGRKDFGLVAPGIRQVGQNYTDSGLPAC